VTALGMDASALETLLYRQSGLLGMSDVSSDMRTLLASDEAAAREAIDLFVYRIVREMGSLAAALGGVDAIVFTGGIGENAAPIRARVLDGARWLGAVVDEAANARHGPRITAADAKVSAWVIPTDENLMVARHARRLLATPSAGTP
jgi:acetate kinase